MFRYTLLTLGAVLSGLSLTDASAANADLARCRTSCAVDASRAEEMCRDTHHEAVAEANRRLRAQRDELARVSAAEGRKAFDASKSGEDLSWDTLRQQNEVLGALKRRSTEIAVDQERTQKELNTSLLRCREKVRNETYRCQAMCY